ncbi:hypothetical protein ACFS07_10840 [Undibacterium arcticum]
MTPFASRARDKALHAVLVSMIRHGDAAMARTARLDQAPDGLLADVVSEIERRIRSIDDRELALAEREIDSRLADWEARAPMSYINPFKPASSLLQYAETHAKKGWQQAGCPALAGRQ